MNKYLYSSNDQVTLYKGNNLEVLKTLPDESINCVVTSPPYYGLRDYGEDEQIGLESTPEEYVENMTQIFREVKRVLAKDGTLWLNLGDSYAGAMSRASSGGRAGYGTPREGVFKRISGNLKAKDLMMIPAKVAIALQEDGWYLRSDIIWHKPAPMPESVRDRPTKSHEYIFLLSKSAKYYYDADAIKEPAKDWGTRDRTNGKYHNKGTGLQPHSGLTKSYPTKNKRSVWTINTASYSDAHFAVFPEEIPMNCIKAGTKEGDVVLDPFVGSGTTLLVSQKLGRKSVGIDINNEYLDICLKRTDQLNLL